MVIAATALAALATAFISPMVTGFATVVALNFALGRAEFVPFSRFAMFAVPSRRRSVLRFEDGTGAAIDVHALGIRPSLPQKRFTVELQEARKAGTPENQARQRAAEAVARWVGQCRPASGSLANEPIAVVMIDYELEGGAIVKRRRPLAVVPIV